MGINVFSKFRQEYSWPNVWKKKQKVSQQPCEISRWFQKTTWATSIAIVSHAIYPGFLGQTLPPTLAATRMALPHGCSGWGGEGWNDTLQPRVQLRLTANKQIMWCASPSQSLTITQYCLGLIVYNIVAVKIFHRYRNIALSIRALVSTPKSPLPWGDWGPV